MEQVFAQADSETITQLISILEAWSAKFKARGTKGYTRPVDNTISLIISSSIIIAIATANIIIISVIIIVIIITIIIYDHILSYMMSIYDRPV